MADALACGPSPPDISSDIPVEGTEAPTSPQHMQPRASALFRLILTFSLRGCGWPTHTQEDDEYSEDEVASDLYSTDINYRMHTIGLLWGVAMHSQEDDEYSEDEGDASKAVAGAPVKAGGDVINVFTVASGAGCPAWPAC